MNKTLTPTELLQLADRLLSLKSNLEEKIKPTDIVDYLDQFIIGQDRLKKVLAVAATSYIDSLNSGKKSIMPNTLIVGPTGCGKTYACSLLAKKLKIPFYTLDCSTLVSSGIKGLTLGDQLSSLYLKLKSIKQDKCVLLLDEMDKMMSSDSVSKDTVKYEFLKLLEGGTIQIETPDENGRDKPTTINVSKFFIIASGAFSEFTFSEPKTLGFNKQKAQGLAKEQSNLRDKLLKAGVAPEILGRFAFLGNLDKLSKDQLKQVLKLENSNFQKFLSTFKDRDISLNFSEEALERLAENALDLSLGARGLDNVVNDIFLELQYTLFSLDTDTSISINIGVDELKKLENGEDIF